MESFGFALQIIKTGGKMARHGWNGKGMHIAAQFPDENSMNKAPYIYIVPVDGNRVPWVASQTDMLANDWYEVTE